MTRELTRLENDKRNAVRESARRAFVINQIGSWLKDNSFYIRLFVIAGVISLAVFLIVLLFRYLLSRPFLVKRQARAAADNTGLDVTPAEPGRLLTLEAEGRYGEAVLLLHRLTVSHLMERNFLPSKNLTNRAILARLPVKPLAEVFRLIADSSERILFDRAEASRDDFRRCRAAYERAFREGR